MGPIVPGADMISIDVTVVPECSMPVTMMPGFVPYLDDAWPPWPLATGRQLIKKSAHLNTRHSQDKIFQCENSAPAGGRSVGQGACCARRLTSRRHEGRHSSILLGRYTACNDV